MVSPPTPSSLDEAANRLLQEGPAAALRYLAENADLADPAVLRRIQAIVFLHRERIEAEAGPEFLQQAVFDPIFCQCSICQRTWSISPVLTSPTIPAEELKPLIDESQTRSCPACGRAYCRRCAATAGTDCTCGGQLEPLVRPNGRKTRREGAELEETPAYIRRLRNETPLASDPELHLYFGKDGKVPIALDPAFPLSQAADSEAHLDWAEALLEAGLYYQAQQQLELSGKSADQDGRAAWLRARLRWVQLHNFTAAYREHRVFATYEANRAREAEIHELLEQASRHSPQDGRIWLDRARACLEAELRRVDPAQALAHARQAQQVLNDEPRAFLLEGQALYQLGQYEAALSALRKIPPNSEIYAEAQKQITLAELALRCQAEPLDIQAHLQLGHWLWRHDQRTASRPVFDRLVKGEPECAESLFVQGLLVWFDYRHPQRFNLSHRYYQQALGVKPDFGLVYQYLGILYHAFPEGTEALDYTPGDPVACYQRAVELDPTCDLALGELGQLAIDRGDIPAALSFLEQAAALDTTSNDVYLNLSAIYLGTRQFEKQEQAYRKAKELEPMIELSAEYVDRILALCNFEV